VADKIEDLKFSMIFFKKKEVYMYQSMAQPGFLDQWANFASVGENDGQNGQSFC